MIIHNPILTGSFTVNGTDVSSITSSAASITAINSYTASQNILNGTYATTGSNTFAGIQTVNSNLVVTGSITAATLVVQTITSSIVYSSGSNVFGNNIANTQVFTGSMNLTGSLTVVTTGTEFQVGATGVNFGNALTDSHVISGSVRINPSGLFISSSGNIGIGTILPNAYSGYTTLTINNTTTGAVLDLNRSGTRTGTFYADTSGVGIGSLIATNLDIFTGNSYINFQTSGSERMRITSAGNVGIGTSSPTAISGFTSVCVNNATTGGFFEAQQGGTVLSRYGAQNDISFIDTVANIPFIIKTNSTERMRITSGGAVFIGTSTGETNYDHSIFNVSSKNTLVVKQTSAAANSCLSTWNNATSGNNLFQAFEINTGGNSAGSIDYLRSSSVVRFNTTSDANLKNIIGDSDKQKSINILNSTRIREYSWKEDETNKPQIGVIAQELYETFKGAVSKGSDNEEFGTEDYKEWAVDKTAFTFHLIAGWQKHEQMIQEQQALITSLQAQINELKNK